MAPDGGALAPISEPQPDGTLVGAPARARRSAELPDAGVDIRATGIAEAEGISRSAIGRIPRLAPLAPGIVEVVLSRRTDRTVMSEGWSSRCRTERAEQPRALRAGVADQ